MGARLRRLWLRATSMGVAEAPPDERRLVRVVNECAVFVFLLSGGFAMVYAAAGPQFWPGTVGNAASALGGPLILYLNDRGLRRAGRRLLPLAVACGVVGGVVTVGPAAGFQFFLLLGLPGLVLLSRRDPAIVAICIAALAGFCWIEYGVDPAVAAVAIDPRILTALHAQSALVSIGVVSFLVARLYRGVVAAEHALSIENERSERLLLNILPAVISERLKAGEEPIADRFEGVTVLFADLVGFTELSSRMEPDELVSLLDEVFTRFDTRCTLAGGEKIKTIGDAYMVAFGLPEPRPDHAPAAVELALAMQVELEEVAAERGVALSLRIGLHSGNVVAGVIGKSKFIYDLWGDTVNTASRMESHGVVGGIHLTDAVRRLIEPAYELTSRGTIAIKGKGEMETYLLAGRRSPA
jgi:class 3 adenylate cyclase